MTGSTLTGGTLTGHSPASSVSRRRIEIRGTVQGVGFRPWVYRVAHADHIHGCVRNDASGVTIDAWGEPADLDAFCHHLASPPAAASIREMHAEVCPVDTGSPARDEMPRSFDIVPSTFGEPRRLSIPPDLATCDDCLREIFDPENRRYRYAFTNCTHCGPRFTLTTGTPYDRTQTTMATFSLCPECAHEYADPLDRRFHAQPNACPVCGPQLWIEIAGTVSGTVSGTVAAPENELLDPLRAVARRLRSGQIVAIKGLGGFHLACLADSGGAVLRLRNRKHRPHKPFAVMVADLDVARRYAHIDTTEAKLLTGVERPIVLLRRRADAEPPLAESVAPGLDQVGLLLPYTPLHHLLLAEVGRPLVMTSGNLSDEPIAFHNEEAYERLVAIADAFLFHDRPIARPCDDSVARVIAGTPTILRRSRGFTPRPIQLPQPLPFPILACGAQLKNTICLGVGDSAWFGPHVGDLETPEAAAFLEASVREMEHLLGVCPELIAHDLHPDYHSTRFAELHAEEIGARTLAVQHHHAHVLSVMAEHQVTGTVLGIALDGVGLGSDGNAWGGEILRVDPDGLRRLATLRPLRLAGGDKAVREPWRLALSSLDDAFGGATPIADLEILRDRSEEELRTVRKLAERGVNAPWAHGAGRYFDAVGALLTKRPVASYEGHLAVLLESLARPAAHRAEAQSPFPVRLSSDDESVVPGPLEIDLRPGLRSLVDGILGDAEPAVLAVRFHRSMAHGIALALDRILHTDRALRRAAVPVALSGGCFQNDLLTRLLLTELEALGIANVFRHSQVPPGDGGLALGQLMAAAHLATRR